jgi:hypothetical protein
VKPLVVFDIECYCNFFCINFKSLADGRTKHFMMFDGHPLDRAGIIKILRSFTIIGFNSNNYDVPILRLALRQGTTNAMLKRMTNRIIVSGLKPWECEKEFDLPPLPWLDHIDLIEPSPSVKVGLKLYGGRLNSRKLQDLPIEPDAIITPEQRGILVDYCYNDLACTEDLYNHIAPQLELRAQMSEQYGVDLRSKSDAQIAEAVVKRELERIKGDKLFRPQLPSDYSFKYLPPPFLSFESEQLQDAFELICDTTFVLSKTPVRSSSGDGESDAAYVGGVRVKIGGVVLPKEIKNLKIKLGSSVYRMGIGGLHSSESKVSHFTDDDYVLVDNDVASYYPSILLACGLYPEHLGADFLDVYREIKERRIAAKRAKNKVIDMTLKIVLNGTFGKLGSKWSVLYAPNLMLQVTITGQLALLMLIERLEAIGISVVSANTDGIVSKVPRGAIEKMKAIVKAWEIETGFDMEPAVYLALYSRDVNAYVAVKASSEDEPEVYRQLYGDAWGGFGSGVKQKGAYAFVGSKGSPAEKNPANYICVDAVIAYLTKGTPIMETLEWCPDIRRFLTVRRVTGGATYKGDYLGKVVRWYYATGDTDCIRRATNGDKVARSDGCKPMMELTGGLPADLDYSFYYNEALSMLGELGVL